MNFSEWITIVSIVIAVIIAVFRYDEREIIRLKKGGKYIILLSLVLSISGISSFFHSNPHPAIIDFLWFNEGIYSGLWPLIWLIIFVVLFKVLWDKFIHQSPNITLIEHYQDILKHDENRFATLFRKYEKYFFYNIEDRNWLKYEDILELQQWWRIAPTHFKDVIKHHPDRFFDMKRDVLINLLTFQFSGINTTLMDEINSLTSHETIIDDKPLLNIFLQDSKSIQKSRNENILLPTVKRSALKYFSSFNFIELERKILILKPNEETYNSPIPIEIMLFHYIHFINWYWVRVIFTKAKVAGFHQYKLWTELILDNAPFLDDDKCTGGQPNYYCVAVDNILRNINDWIDLINENNSSDLRWAIDHFIFLKLSILVKLNNCYSKKIVNSWYIKKITSFLFNLIHCFKLYGESFNIPQLNDYRFPLAELDKAIDDMIDQEFVTSQEKESRAYIWIMKLLKNW